MMSADGRYAVFVSNASNLVGKPGVVDNEWVTNVYRYDRLTGDVVLVSVNGTDTGGGNNSSYQPVISADGNIVAFTSGATDLIEGQWFYSGYAQVFVRNISEAVTQSVSTNADRLATGGSHFPAISGNGRLVAFESMNDTLSPLDTDSNRDIYVRDVETGEVQLVSIDSSGTGSGNKWAHSPRISADGSTIIFSSESTNLHPLDADDEWDLFVRGSTPIQPS